MRFLCAVGFLDRDRIILKGELLCVVDEVAIKGLATVLEGENGVFAVQFSGHRALKCGGHGGDHVFTHDSADIIHPQGILFLGRDGIKQADVDSSVFPNFPDGKPNGYVL